LVREKIAIKVTALCGTGYGDGDKLGEKYDNNRENIAEACVQIPSMMINNNVLRCNR
jgi:hypothetical protein